MADAFEDSKTIIIIIVVIIIIIIIIIIIRLVLLLELICSTIFLFLRFYITIPLQATKCICSVM